MLNNLFLFICQSCFRYDSSRRRISWYRYQCWWE